MSLQEMELQANKLIEQEETEPAVKLIYEIVVGWAQAKDFSKANAWRDRLIKIDPMALGEIVDSAEIIEAEKADAIDDNHKTTWEKLYDSLTQEEANSFYLKLKQLEFPPGKVLIQQGKLNENLFFIDHGRLKIIFRKASKELFLKELDTGDTVGQETFFHLSSCTTSVVTVSPVKIRLLKKPALKEIETEFPGFTKKLQDYCSLLDVKNTETILKNKALERRELKRHKLAGKITSQIIDKNGSPLGSAFHGWLVDISVGGAAFSIQCSNPDVGRTLLGRLSTLTIRIDKGPQIKVEGLIVGAKFDLFYTYMIHLRFSKPFNELKLKNLVATYPASSSSPPNKP